MIYDAKIKIYWQAKDTSHEKQEKNDYNPNPKDLKQMAKRDEDKCWGNTIEGMQWRKDLLP